MSNGENNPKFDEIVENWVFIPALADTVPT